MRRKTTIMQDAIVARRRVLRAAFDVMRPDPAQKTLITRLAKALGGSGELTSGLYEEATAICEQNNSYHLVADAARLAESAKTLERKRRQRAARLLLSDVP